MAVRKATNKIHNKKLRRRREGLSTKSYEYGELDGVELALFIRYPKRGDFYSYLSVQQLPWLRDINEMMKHPKARNEGPEQVRTRIEEARRKLKKPSDMIIGEGCDPDGATVSRSSVALAFPEFPELNLTILRRIPSDSGR